MYNTVFSGSYFLAGVAGSLVCAECTSLLLLDGQNGRQDIEMNLTLPSGDSLWEISIFPLMAFGAQNTFFQKS